jgi:hypothetical protein
MRYRQILDVSPPRDAQGGRWEGEGREVIESAWQGATGWRGNTVGSMSQQNRKARQLGSSRLVNDVSRCVACV